MIYGQDGDKLIFFIIKFFPNNFINQLFSQQNNSYIIVCSTSDSFQTLLFYKFINKIII